MIVVFLRKEVLKESNFKEEPRDVVKAGKLSSRKKEAEIGAPMSLVMIEGDEVRNFIRHCDKIIEQNLFLAKLRPLEALSITVKVH